MSYGTDIPLIRLLIESADRTIFARSWAPWVRYVLLIIIVFVLVATGRVIVFGTPLPLPM